MNRTFNVDNLDINPQFKRAISAIEQQQNVFITGRAGTGKSTLLEYFRSITKKNVAVLAPTGVAAVNVRGQTIHSFFGFRPDVTMDKVLRGKKKPQHPSLYTKLDYLIIDEISMVRADLFDCIDAFLRKYGKVPGAPFGGTQIILVGDLYQLPPVVTREEQSIFSSHYPSPYFFDAFSFAGLNISIIELETIYRQTDRDFIDLLQAVRNKALNTTLLHTLNTRVDHEFEPDYEDVYIHLVTTNAQAATINDTQIMRLKSDAHSYAGKTTGEFDQKSLPAPITLQLKVGAQVMLTNNDPSKRWVNGTVGVVTAIDTGIEEDIVWIKLETGITVDVLPHEWEMFRFTYNEENAAIETATTGTYSQYPLILAWAITIHKSQGKTFKRCVVDLGRGTFAHGQAYVALSRCTTLEGMILKNPISEQHILLDQRIVEFLNNYAPTPTLW